MRECKWFGEYKDDVCPYCTTKLSVMDIMQWSEQSIQKDPDGLAEFKRLVGIWVKKEDIKP